MSRPQITIDNITFFLIRVVDNMHKRYSDILEIHSQEEGKSPFSFWVYRSNSELGFWRLCITKSNSLQNLLWYKGTIDYVQATFVHLELQNFINENIQYVPKIQLNAIEKMTECVCYINTRHCSPSNQLALEQIDDPERMISEEPFSLIQSLDDDTKHTRPVGCGRIPSGFTDADVKGILQEFSDNLKSEYRYDRRSLTRVSSFSFNFEKLIDSVGEIYCIRLNRIIPLKDSQTNTVLIYFLKTKLNIDPLLIANPSRSLFTRNITRICSRDYHVFPFFITNNHSRVTKMGLYSKYIPSGLFICKLFDYYGYSQCTVEEMRNEKCTMDYSYIGKRYDDLFPLKEAIEELSSVCEISGKQTRSSSTSLSKASSYETTSSQTPLRSLKARFYKDFKKLKHFHKMNKSKKIKNKTTRRLKRSTKSKIYKKIFNYL
jgi:hypothetical protein